MIPSLDAVAPTRSDRWFQIGRTVFAGRTRRTELLGLGHPHGWDLEWLDRSHVVAQETEA